MLCKYNPRAGPRKWEGVGVEGGQGASQSPHGQKSSKLSPWLEHSPGSLCTRPVFLGRASVPTLVSDLGSPACLYYPTPPGPFASPEAAWTQHSSQPSTQTTSKRPPHSPLLPRSTPTLASHPQSHRAVTQHVSCKWTQEEADCGIHSSPSSPSGPGSQRCMFLISSSISPSLLSFFLLPLLPLYSHYHTLTVHLLPPIYTRFHFPESLVLWFICHFLANHNIFLEACIFSPHYFCLPSSQRHWGE